jgi:uncharacterized damage-inducible protein DinB
VNPFDVMRYGHLTVLGAIEGLPDEEWDEGCVCGVWSTRQIIAHLASYELLLEDVLRALVEDAESPRLEQYLASGEAFNDEEVAKRNARSVRETLEEYSAAYEAVAAIASQVPAHTWNEVGTLPWYGGEYSLDDWVVYQFYGHKREHTAQIAVFRDRIGR